MGGLMLKKFVEKNYDFVITLIIIFVIVFCVLSYLLLDYYHII